MQFHAKSALLFLLFCSAALAQQRQGGPNGAYRATGEDSAPQRQTTSSRPLTPDEGLAILGAALDSRHHPVSTADCSHLVHALYERAGFSYGYAPSSDLYLGIDEFQRVTNPQPGDLAVWRGHAGIVVNPLQHSFFSLLNSGPGVDSYDAPYWRQRGRPRFFRYVKAAPSGVLSGSLRTASMKPAVEDQVSDDSEEESSSETRSSTSLAPKQMNTLIPRVPVVHSIHPTPDRVNAAFLQACTDSEESLRGRDLFKSVQPLIVFDHFAVSEVHIAGNQAWVEVQIDEVLFLIEGKAEARKGVERQRWPLSRRDKTSWELTPPRHTIYLPQQIAARILAQQLAQLTGDNPGTPARPQEKAELARLLDALLKE